MENNGLAGGIFSGMSSGMLGLEMPLHQQQQNHQNPQNSHPLHHTQIVAYPPHHDSDHNHHHHHLQSQQSAKISYPYPNTAKAKPQSPLSDEDEPCFNGDESTSDGKRKAAAMSPWQRMKWTDNMVRLLIMAVFYIGDEAGSEPNDPTAKKKAGGGLSQKKGKWKSVSRAMMEKGFYVSPQQCEDKFNDLNKRYKRVNDILGKGTACKVVENQSLLESMDLSPKMKDEVKKLLNSKHLFFREMCAYHNSCGHITSNSVGPVNDQSLTQQPQPSHNSVQQGCSHSPENPQFLANSSRTEAEIPKMGRRVPIDEGDEEEEEEEESEEEGDDSEEDDDDDAIEGNPRGQNNGYGDHDEDDHVEKPNRKRQRTTTTTTTTSTAAQVFSISSVVMQQLNSEVTGVIEDGGKSQWEKKHWMRVRLMRLEEQQVRYQHQACELERQRLKWVKFSSKKEREMERSKLENERRRLENERMVLLIRQKELELLDLQQIHHHQQQQQQFSSNKIGDPSSVTG